MLDNREYQNETIKVIQGLHQSSKLIPVLAACPGAGKTVMSLRVIDDYIKSNPKARVLVLPHGTVVLRDQYYQELCKICPHLIDKTSLVDNSSNFKLNTVVIGLPQSIENIELTEGMFDLIVVDEAHHRYLGLQGQTIINKIKPKHQLLLTGTPSKFIYHNKNYKPKFHIHAIALQDIREVMAKLQVEVCASGYSLNNGDYNTRGEVIETAVQNNFNNRDKTYDTVENVIHALFEKMSKAPFTKMPNDKFMIVCKSIEQADLVQEKLTEMGLTNISSNSVNDSKNENITKFKKSTKYQFLVVVDRGILGFDDKELSGLIDLSGTRNLDKMYQAMARVVRQSKDNRFKLYMKVSECNTEEAIDYTVYLVRGMLQLTFKEYILMFDGTNSGDIPVPVLVDKDKKVVKRTVVLEDGRQKTYTKPALFEEPYDVLECMEKAYIEYKSGLATYAHTTLQRLGQEFKTLSDNIEMRKEEILHFIQEYGARPKSTAICRKERYLGKICDMLCRPSSFTYDETFVNSVNTSILTNGFRLIKDFVNKNKRLPYYLGKYKHETDLYKMLTKLVNTDSKYLNWAISHGYGEKKVMEPLLSRLQNYYNKYWILPSKNSPSTEKPGQIKLHRELIRALDTNHNSYSIEVVEWVGCTATKPEKERIEKELKKLKKIK